MKKLLLIVTLLMASVFVYPQIMFERTYGGANYDSGLGVIQTNDGGYAVIGYTKSYGAGKNDIYLIKTNALGDTLWTKTYGGVEDDFGYQIIQQNDGSYIICGSTKSFGNGGHDAYLVKIDVLGNIVWTKTYGGSLNDRAVGIIQTFDGGYFILGTTGSYGAGGIDMYFIRTNNLGDTLWTKTYGGVESDWGQCALQTSDGGFIILGTRETGYPFNTYISLLKVDLNGSIVWTKTYSGSHYCNGSKIIKTNDLGYIIIGSTDSYGAGSYDIYLIKTDSIGNMMWTKTYGGAYPDFGTSIIQTDDNGFILGGYMELTATSYFVASIIKINSIGDTLWTRYFSNGFETTFLSLAPTNDGGYIFTGYQEAYHESPYDVYLVKTNANGIVGLNDERLNMNNFKIYPNPATSKINIQIPKQFGQTITLEIIDCVGKRQILQTGRFTEIDITNLTSGLYFIVLTNTNNERQTIKIIKE